MPYSDAPLDKSLVSVITNFHCFTDTFFSLQSTANVIATKSVYSAYHVIKMMDYILGLENHYSGDI